MKKHCNLIWTVAVFVLLSSCSKDDPDPMPTPVVNNLSVLDVANNGDGNDLEIEFNKVNNEDLVSEYRVMVVKSASASNFDIDMALTLTSDRYLVVNKDGNNKRLELHSGLRDTDGDDIAEMVDYNLFVMSVAHPNNADQGAISGPSNTVVLEQRNAIRTLAVLENAGAGGVQVDSEGNVYMSDFGLDTNGGGSNVFKITPSGEVSVFANGLNTGDGNDIDSNGYLYQVSFLNHIIYRIDPAGEKTVFASGGLINGPIGIAIDDNDELYVTNYNNNTVVHITQAGVVSLFSSSSYFDGPNGLDFDSAGDLYISNWNTNQIVKINISDGSDELFVETPSVRNAHLIINNDLIYVAGRSHHTIFEVDIASKAISDFVGNGTKGGLNGALENATITWPNDIAFNQDGTKMYFSMASPSAQTSNIISPAIIREVSIVE